MHYNENSTLKRRIANLIFTFVPLIFWVLLIYSFDDPSIASLTLICAVIHEVGHELFIFLKTGSIFSPKSILNGLKIRNRLTAHMSYTDEAMLYLSGPLANITAAVISLPFFGKSGDYTVYFAVTNAATAISNLLPINGYDGYGIARCMLRKHTQSSTPLKALDAVSFAFTVILCLLSLYLIDRLGESYWIFAVFIVSLIGSVSKSLKNAKNEEN